MEYFIDAWRQYANFSGRATRPQFWWFALIHSAIIAGLILAFNAAGQLVDATNGFADHPLTYAVAMVISAYLAASAPPALAITVRRLHDSGRRGWWLLLILVPVLGTLVLIALLSVDSERWRPNRWGPQPTGW